MAEEIEMNFKVKDKSSLLLYLRSFGKEKLSLVKFTYLGRHGDSSFYIRIKETKCSGQEKKFLEAKGKFKKAEGVNKREEISLVAQEDNQKYIDFLLLIGMELRDCKEKIKHEFLIEGLKVTLDEWNVAELGDRLEVEGLDETKVKEFASKIIFYCDPIPSE